MAACQGAGPAQAVGGWSEDMGSPWKMGRVGSVGPEESTFHVAGGTQGSCGGFEQGSDMKRPCTGATGAVQAVRKAEERLCGRTAWPESHRQVRAACVQRRQMQNTKDKSRSGVRISRTLSVLDRACGCGISESQRKVLRT